MSYRVEYGSSHKATVKLTISGPVASLATTEAMRDLNLKVDSLAAEHEVGADWDWSVRKHQSSLLEVVFESSDSIHRVREAALDLCSWLKSNPRYESHD